MNPAEARALLDEHVHTDWLKKHCLATAAIMESLAPRFGGDPQAWWSVGLLHDLDFDRTQDLHRHGLESAEILRSRGMAQEEVQAILAHNAEGLGLERTTTLDYALTCAESITGLIVATALVMPDRKLASVTGEGVLKKMKKKDFARKVSREHVELCEKIGIPLEEFAALSVAAMQASAEELGL
ncbi:MAG: HDIG domain-containing protein [Spirochaetales bacterium]|nr:HDIG domain-containing protein [Spirochaetales bacterium]